LGAEKRKRIRRRYHSPQKKRGTCEKEGFSFYTRMGHIGKQGKEDERERRRKGKGSPLKEKKKLLGKKLLNNAYDCQKKTTLLKEEEGIGWEKKRKK